MRRSRGFTATAFLRSVCLLFFASALWGQNAPVRNESAASLVEQFKSEPVFWKQFEIAQKIVALRDPWVLHELEPWLSNKDMHARGNAGLFLRSSGMIEAFRRFGRFWKTARLTARWRR
jgi:hypothetical protein